MLFQRPPAKARNAAGEHGNSLLGFSIAGNTEHPYRHGMNMKMPPLQQMMNQKVLTLDNLLPRIAVHQQAGEIIVFTNGCFDLIHIGHTRYLQEAKQLGERLVVGINSDASVRRLAKGANRPIVPGMQRAEVIAAFSSVDYVILFDEPDPFTLIQALKPNVLVKGGDWTPERIIGKDFVEERGGFVRTIPLVPDVSTTAIIQRILTAHGISPAS